MAAITAAASRFRLIFNVPPSGLEACKKAIFAAGAGRYPGPGEYTECCWTTIGTGQFRPGKSANPHLGKPGDLETVEEVRLETICVGEDVARKAVTALKEQVSSIFSLLLSFSRLTTSCAVRIRMRNPHTAYTSWRTSEYFYT